MLGRRRFLGATLGLMASSGAEAWAQSKPVSTKKPSPKSAAKTTRPPAEPTQTDEQLNRILAGVRDRHHLPGMVGGIVLGDRLAVIGAVGIRKIGSEELIAIGDRMHLGSCTKAMTATLVGMLVDDGKLRWDSTLGEVFPHHAERLHPDFQSVTLTHLLTHRAGLPHDGPWWMLGRGRSTTDQRRALLDRMLSQPPISRPGTTYAYSNVGFVLAGLMAEQVTEKSWEQLMRQRLFEPLGMATAGFGCPARQGRVDQPWGHRDRDGQIRPVLEDNAPCTGPACTVHASLSDWAKFAVLHLRGEQGKGQLLKPATFRALHTPPSGGDYAGGWFIREQSWAAGRTFMHKGSNLSWYATIWVAPTRDSAYLVATNQGGDEADKACDEATEALIRYHAFSLNTGPRRKRNGRR